MIDNKEYKSSFFTEKEIKEMGHVQRMAKLMETKEISIKELSWHIHYTGEEIYRVYMELDYNKELVDEAIAFLESLF